MADRKPPINRGGGEDRSPPKARSEIILRAPSAHVTTSVDVGELGTGRMELGLRGHNLPEQTQHNRKKHLPRARSPVAP